MARANPFDPKVSSVTSVLYCTPTSNNNGFQIPYAPGTTLTELSPKGQICQASTLSTTAPW